MALGNQDGYFLGNFYPNDYGPTDGEMTNASWRLACEDRAYFGSLTKEVRSLLPPKMDWDGRTDLNSAIPGPGKPFDRNEFIRRYLQHHGYNSNKTQGSITIANGQLILSWVINERRPWKSFIVQSLSIKVGEAKLFAVVLDTSQVWERR